MEFRTVNPATGEELERFDFWSDERLEQALARAAAAFEVNRRRSFEERAAPMRKVGERLEAEAPRFAEMITTEMGKLRREGEAEVRKCAWVCRYYADHAAEQLADEEIATEAARSFVRYQPLGPILAVMPWNFPFWQVLRFAAPAIMAGNVGLLKHAPNVPRCALTIEKLFVEAGYEPGIFQSLFIDVDKIPKVLADPRVAAATLTGSDRAGSALAEAAGRSLKKTVLELGGSDPFIVTPSADLDAAVSTGLKARLLNNGQSCIAAKRFILFEDVADEFQKRFVAGLEKLQVGDPLEEQTQLGPLARGDLRDRLAEQVEQSVKAGARLVTGGEPLSRPGFFYAPSALAEIPTEAPAYRQELFGPVASFYRVRNEEEAIELANSTEFGLGSSVWTRDDDQAMRFANAIESGAVFVNAMTSSDPRLPFGGVKRSGYGRELSHHGIREFTNAKTVSVTK